MIEIATEDLPEISEWEEGKRYKVELVVQQTSDAENGSASFSVVQANGKPAPKGEDEDDENYRSNKDRPTENEGSFRGRLRKQLNGRSNATGQTNG